jgi:hypothetical protein
MEGVIVDNDDEENEEDVEGEILFDLRFFCC